MENNFNIGNWLHRRGNMLTSVDLMYTSESKNVFLLHRKRDE